MILVIFTNVLYGKTWENVQNRMLSWFEPHKWGFRPNFVPYPMGLVARDFLSQIWNIEIFVPWNGGGTWKDARNGHFWPFSPKMTYFDQIDTINDTFDQIYIHKPDWNKFLKTFREKIIWPLSPNFHLWRHFYFSINLVKNVINLVKIGHFWWKWWKSGHIWGQNDFIDQNFGEVVK